MSCGLWDSYFNADACKLVKDAAKFSEFMETVADETDNFAKVFPQNDKRRQKLEAVSGKIKGVTGKVGKAKNLMSKLSEIQKICDAWNELSGINFETDAQKAAKQFDIMFVSFGSVVEVLPPPANEWAQFFKEAGGFFETMGQKLNTDRYKGTPYEKYMP
ncbi:MAG: hypothetical protein AAF615_00275 [Pseudomonadota bacterium]